MVEAFTPRDTSPKQSRGRSTIEFPYGALDDAIGVAKAIHTQAGDGCTYAQLSAYLGYGNVDSGTFRQRVSAARQFGLIATDAGEVRLLPLGRQIIDPNTAAVAKRDAFLHVPLYRKLFDKYSGYQLPPDVGLEREIAALGVTAKQVDKARQTFQRSAEQAGFFPTGRDRLVMPSGLPITPTMPPKAEAPPGGGGGGTGHDDPNMYIVPLKSGGRITLSVTVDLFAMSPEDRSFVFELVDRVKQYKEKTSVAQDQSSQMAIGGTGLQTTLGQMNEETELAVGSPNGSGNS